MALPEPQSPEWWRLKLHDRLQKRRKLLDKYDAYYEGRFPLPWLAPEAVYTYRRLLRLSRSNYTGLVCDALAERLIVEGFRLGPGQDEPDEQTWDIWQGNNLDSESDQAILDAVIRGCSFYMVAPNPADSSLPLITVEDATQVIVAYASGNRREKLAGLKVWQDEWENLTFATLYLPDAIYKWQAESKAGEQMQPPPTAYRWKERTNGNESWPAPNPTDGVPFFELVNNPLRGVGRSEISDALDIQDRICKTIIDRLLTQDSGAFPQKWATGLPVENDDGEEQEVQIGRDRLVRTDVIEARFGQFESAALDPYSTAKREDVRDMAARTRTPAQYLLGEFNNVNGETLRAAESGLVAKSRQRCRTFGETKEDMMRAARQLAGSPGDDSRMETVWRNPEFRTEGELVDALIKMATLRVPLEALWERWGASATERSRWKRLAAQEAMTPVAQALISNLGTPAPAPLALPSSVPAVPPVA